MAACGRNKTKRAGPHRTRRGASQPPRGTRASKTIYVCVVPKVVPLPSLPHATNEREDLVDKRREERGGPSQKESFSFRCWTEQAMMTKTSAPLRPRTARRRNGAPRRRQLEKRRPFRSLMPLYGAREALERRKRGVREAPGYLAVLAALRSELPAARPAGQVSPPAAPTTRSFQIQNWKLR